MWFLQRFDSLRWRAVCIVEKCRQVAGDAVCRKREYLKMSDFKVSVIVPVFNASRYIEMCLDSIRKQTLKGLEIICVDDGSTDGSREILNAYSCKYKNV